MKISKEEILHIANLASLEIKEDEIGEYAKNLEEILNFADIVNNANTNNLDITVGSNKAENVFRKDEVKDFENKEMLLENAPSKDRNMYKIPKVLN